MLFNVFLAYLILLILRPHEFDPALANVPILQIVLLVGCAAWAVSRDKHFEYPQFKLIPPLLAIIWIGVGLSGAGWWSGLVDALDKLLPPLLMFVVATGAVRSVRQLRIVAYTLVGCACLLVLHGHLQLRDGVGWTGALPNEGRITYSGIFNDPNDLGLLFVIGFGLAIYLLGTARSRLQKILLLAALGWIGYGVLLTDSRGTLLGTLAIIAFYARARFGTRGLIVAAVAAVPLLVMNTRLAQLDPTEESAEGRLDAWYEGIQMLREYPLFGVGFGNFTDHHFMTAHNSLVLAMAELGLVGYPLWLAFMGYSAYMLYWLTYRHAPTEPASAAATEVAAARGLFVTALGLGVGAFFLSQSYKFMLFLMCGLAVGRFAGASTVLTGMPTFKLAAALPRWFGLALLTVIGLWVLLKFTL